MPSPTMSPGVLTPELQALPDHPVVSDAHATFATVHAALEKLEAAEEAIKLDRTLTESAQRAAANQLREKLATRLTKTLDDSYNRALDGVRASEESATAALSPELRTVDAHEIRRHVAELSETKRSTFILQRAGAGDRESLNAIFEAPPFLSGLSDADQGTLRDAALAKVAPDVFHERETLRRVVERIERAGKAFAIKYITPAGAFDAANAKRRADAVSAVLDEKEA